MKRLYVLILTLTAAGSAGADGICRAKCILVNDGETAAAELKSWPRPGLEIMLMDDLGPVEGLTTEALGAECTRRERMVLSKYPAGTRSLLVTSTAYYEYGGKRAVMYFSELKSCSDF